MKHSLGLICAMAAFWLALSGHYTGLLLSLGALSIALIAWMAHRMDVVDHEAVPLSVSWRLPLVWAWLGLEIIKSSIDVLIRIYKGPSALKPTMRTIQHNQPGELNTTLFANAITLTPGTLSVEVTENTINIHTVHAELLDGLEGGEMARRVQSAHRRSRALGDAAGDGSDDAPAKAVDGVNQP